MPKQINKLFLFSCLNKLNTQTDLKGPYFVYVADPATFLASNSVAGTLFSSENSLFIQQIFLSLY